MTTDTPEFTAADMATSAADGFRSGMAAALTNFDRVSIWLSAAGKEKTKENLSLQTGCHIEEFTEFLRAISLGSPTGAISNVLVEAAMILDLVATGLKQGQFSVEFHDREAILDALCDADVTGNGVAYFAGFDKNRADKKVLDANDDKFIDGVPVILPGGKIGKRPGWTAPDLTDCI